MKFATATKISTQECYNSEYEVLSLHGDFNSALEQSNGQEITIEVPENINIGDSINDNGKAWQAQV